MTPKTPARIEAERLCEEHPQLGRRKLAELAKKTMPQFGMTDVQWQGHFRRIRGKDKRQDGTDEDRETARDELGGDGWLEQFRKSDAETVEVMRIDAKRIAVLSDIHFPYHDPVSLPTALKYTKDAIKPDCILLNGDIIDNYQMSRFVKNPLNRNLAGEITMMRTFIKTLRKAFPKARIIYNKGNHEGRWETYLFSNAPQLLGIDDFEFDRVLKLKESGVEWVTHSKSILIGGSVHDGEPRGGLLVSHGDEVRGVGGVNPARTMALAKKVSCMTGHFHRSSTHTGRRGDGTTFRCWSLPCLCGLWPEFARSNEWNHGMAHIDVDAQDFRVHMYAIEKGVVYTA